MVEKFKKREEGWDIKIVDFILEKYKEERVFYEAWHCTKIVYKRMSQEILKKLNIDYKNIVGEYESDRYEMPIYPEVREALGLKYGAPEELICTKYQDTIFTSKMDMEEWFHQYIYCYDMCNRKD